MKKIVTLIVLAISLSLLFTGCSTITNILDPLPDNYVDGVKVPKEYPDDDLEIYDDAIVFEAEEDDGEITLIYGTEDDIDDVIEFYEEQFEENGLTVEEQDDSSDEFSAVAGCNGYRFEIDAEEAKGNYEERAFATVVEVNVVQYGKKTLKKLQGFWLCCGFEDEISDTVRMEGTAALFEDMTLYVYSYFEKNDERIEFTFIDDDTITYTEDGEEITLNISFDTIDGVEVLSLSDEDMTFNFEESSETDMLVYADMAGEEGEIILASDELTDDELEYWISDLNWYYKLYLNVNGEIEAAEVYDKFYFGLDYTGEWETAEGIQEITWYVYEGNLYITLPDGEYYWPVDFEYDGEEAYLFLADGREGNEGALWLYTLTPLS